MNKKILSISAALLATAAVTFTSRKDDDDDNPTPTQTNQQKMVGTWLRTGEGVDSNNNNTLEVSEQTAASQYELTTFNADGTFTDTVSGVITGRFGGTWSVDGDYVTINITGIGSGTSRIATLNTTSLTTVDTSVTPTEWTLYTKQ